jgi:hypothetical protein
MQIASIGTNLKDVITAAWRSKEYLLLSRPLHTEAKGIPQMRATGSDSMNLRRDSGNQFRIEPFIKNKIVLP